MTTESAEAAKNLGPLPLSTQLLASSAELSLSTSSCNVQVCFLLFSMNHGVHEQRMVLRLGRNSDLLLMPWEHFGSKPEHSGDSFL